MHLPRARLLACALAASVTLGSFISTAPAIAAPSAACAEPRAAKVARAALRTTFKAEIATFTKVLTSAKAQVVQAKTAQAAVLAAPASTDAQKGIADADVVFPTRLVGTAAAAKAAAIKDRAGIARCGLPAMRKLKTSASSREIHFLIDSLNALKTQGVVHLKWDTITRDAAAAGSTEYTTSAARVATDQLIIRSVDKSVRELQKKLPKR